MSRQCIDPLDMPELLARIILPLSADAERVTMLMMVDSEEQNALHEFLDVIAIYGKPN